MKRQGVRFASGKRFVESMRHQGLHDGDAIKELIDNSLDADARNIHVDIWEENGKINIMIQDDGIGMDKELLERAPAFGQSDNLDRGKIGRFGFGLPTAITSRTRKADIFSKKGKGWYYTYIDLDEIAKSNNLELPFAIRENPEKVYGKKIKKAKTGTVIVMKDCDKLNHKRPATIMKHLKDDIEVTYRVFIFEGINIFLNGEKIKYNDPLMIMKNHLFRNELIKGLKKEEINKDSGYAEQIGDIEDIEVEYIDENGKKRKGYVKIKLVLLPVRDIKRTGGARKYDVRVNAQGFYLMRNKRQISEPSTLNIYQSHPMMSHFRAEICFDSTLDEEFGIQVNKSRFRLSKSMEDRIRNSVKALVAIIRKKQYQIKHELEKGEEQEKGVAEEIAKSAQYRKTKKIKTATEKDIKDAFRKGVESIKSETGLEEEEKKKRINQLKDVLEKQLPFIMDSEHIRQGPIFVWDYLGKTTKVILNREHPFYKYVWLPLIKSEKPPSPIYLKTILKMLIFALTKGEQIHQEELVEGNIITFQELHNHWNLMIRKFLDSDKFLEFYENQGIEYEETGEPEAD